MDPGGIVPWSPPAPVPLQEYIAGHVLREAQQVFEAGISPFVKDAMRAKFGVAPDPAAVAELTAANAAAAAALRTTELPTAIHQRDTAALAAAAATAVGDNKVAKAQSKQLNKARATVHKLKQRLWELDPTEADTAETEANVAKFHAVLRVTAAAAAPNNAKEAEAGMAEQALKVVDSELKAIADAVARASRAGPPPQWLEKCREVLSDMMASFIHNDGAEWDVFTLTSIMQA